LFKEKREGASMRFRVLEDEKRKNLFDAKPYWGASFPLDPRNANSLVYGIFVSEKQTGTMAEPTV